jgi:molybdopterin converting factor small subunit
VARVTVELPSLLAPMAGGARSLDLEADTLRGALEALVGAHPGLSTHLFDERGELRPHVLCLHNRASSRWLEGRDAPVADGDTITVMQAVSGG